MAHNSVTRWLTSANYMPSDLWKHVKPMVDTNEGYLVTDDSLLNRQYSKKNELARMQWYILTVSA
jgi:hypothetical protein